MFYGIISHLDGETTRVFFKNKRVQDANVVYSTQLSALVKMLKAEIYRHWLEGTGRCHPEEYLPWLRIIRK